MAEYSAPATLSSPGPDISFNPNPLSFPTGYHDPDMCSGLEKLGQVRAVTEDRPRTDGGIIYPRLLAPRQFVLGGTVLTGGGGVAAREGWLEDLADVLDALRAGGGTYVWVGAGGTYTVSGVFFDGSFQAPGKYLKKYQFALVADPPTVVIT